MLDLVQPAVEATDIQIWQHPFSVANYYLGLGNAQAGGVSNELNEDFYFTEEHFNLMREATLDYVSMGGHDWVANIVEEAWNHQSYYNDLSMVKWTKKADGTWEFDYTWYDAWVEFGIECGVIDPETGLGQIKCYSIVPWNNQITYYDEASGTTVKESHTPGVAAWTAIWTPFVEDFMAHSLEKGWFDITYISMDERTMDQLEPTVDLIESIQTEDGKSFKISSALNYAAPDYYDFTDRIHDISINLGHCTDREQMNALAEHRRALGLKTTMYTCTGNYPGNFVFSDPGDNYWQIWYTMTLGMDGFLRWAWDNYVYDMHGNVTYRYWEPGDGWYIYPVEREEVGEDYQAGFYSTPRYELFKQGIRDVAKAKYVKLYAIDSVADDVGRHFSAGEIRLVEEVETETPEPTVTEAPQPSVTEEPQPTGTPEVKDDVTEVFDDVYTDWYTDYVQYVYDHNLMTGIKGTNHFEPNTNITKAQVAQVLYNMEGKPEVTSTSVFVELSDVYLTEWYANAVAWAYETGVVTGDTNAKKFSIVRCIYWIKSNHM